MTKKKKKRAERNKKKLKDAVKLQQEDLVKKAMLKAAMNKLKIATDDAMEAATENPKKKAKKDDTCLI